jgi:hypothetical protein
VADDPILDTAALATAGVDQATCRRAADHLMARIVAAAEWKPQREWEGWLTAGTGHPLGVLGADLVRSASNIQWLLQCAAGAPSVAPELVAVAWLIVGVEDAEHGFEESPDAR